MYVYIITNPGKTVFYTGVTNDLKRRLRDHEKNKGTNASFAGRFFCYKLVYYEEFTSIVEAIKREKEIKKLSRINKLKLIEQKNPRFNFLRI